MNSNLNFRRTVLCAALSLCLSSLAVPAFAGNNDGSVVGHTQANAAVTITNPSTGLTRTITADGKGNYRFPFLPVGDYVLTVNSSGNAVGQPRNVTVSLGNATTVDVGSSVSATELSSVSVTGTALPVIDVTSTETATNISRETLQRLPVEQNVTSVTLLAPGVVKGNAGIGGISFGGSSIAENAYYVNGLNVTDFYNRNGFSEAPFDFYQEFQVKTSGYSVEFGRTTGGVVNAVARSGTNDFHYGITTTIEPGNWHSAALDRFDAAGNRYITASRDQASEVKTNVWASGPIIKDKLFFFAMYEKRGDEPHNTDDTGQTMTYTDANNGFWGTTIDWNLTDKNTLSLMAFSDKDHSVGDVYDYDYDTRTVGSKTNVVNNDTGGRNWALSWSSYITDDFSMKLMYGQNERKANTTSQLDEQCNRVIATSALLALNNPGVALGCSTNSTVYARDDKRTQYRADFEWTLGSHLLRFGYDHEKNVSNYAQNYAGPDGYYYNVYTASPGSTIDNGGVMPNGYIGYVRARQYVIAGTFPSINSAVYLEDNWSVTPNLVLNAGIRNDSFDNEDASGRDYIKIDRQIAPRLGFSWDVKGDASMKVFGNLGRYFLPVANVINIKQAGGLLDRRTYYAFNGWDIESLNGVNYATPKLGPQIGAVDDSQGDGTVGDLRSEVDKNMDPVYQDEAILGFQQLISPQWSWGVRGIYRRLHNAIDDMEISATPQCGGDGYIGWVMANPGKKVTVWGDTNCDGTADGYLTIDTSKAGWAMYDSDGNYLGQRGWVKPKRTYEAIELQLDKAWDNKWSFNASYTASWNRGNAEGPVNSDTDFGDTGRTENFDDPYVNLSDGFLPNDRRNQLKLRGTYALNPNWQVGANLEVNSGGPITAYGTGNPFDATDYHSYEICVDKCGFIPGQVDSDGDPVPYPSEDRVYQKSTRGNYGRLPWTYTVDANITYLLPFDGGNMRVKLTAFNLFNQQRTVQVDQDLQSGIGSYNDSFLQPIVFQPPRYVQLSFSAEF
jgi:hypothetical protein